MVLTCVLLSAVISAQPASSILVLQPDRVFDGEQMHAGWAVVVRGERIDAAGPLASMTLPAGARTVVLKGTTLMPGMIEGHSHLLLHPYNETVWNDQVLREPLALRVVRATNHARATLMAGITTVRDLGSEGAAYADVGLRQAINEGIIPGPRMLVAGPAMVVTGSYAPKGFAPEVSVPQGAEEADGLDGVVRVARGQIARGVDLIKIYADYRWGPNGEARPGFTLDETRRIVEAANSSGRPVVAHASTPEGMRRAIMGGVDTIEHGDDGNAEIWKLMVEKNVAFCPTLLGASVERAVTLVSKPDAALTDLVRVGRAVALSTVCALLGVRTALNSIAGEGPGAASSVAKLLGVNNRQDASELVVDLLGDRALLADEDVKADVHEMLLTRCLSIAGGTTQILRNVAAENILGLPR